MEVASKSALVPPPFPLQLIKRPLFEDCELCRGLGVGLGGGRKDGEKGCEDGENDQTMKILIQISS